MMGPLDPDDPDMDVLLVLDVPNMFASGRHPELGVSCHEHDAAVLSIMDFNVYWLDRKKAVAHRGRHFFSGSDPNFSYPQGMEKLDTLNISGRLREAYWLSDGEPYGNHPSTHRHFFFYYE